MKHEELTEKLKEIHSALGKEDVMVCVLKEDEGGQSILMHGRKGAIIASLALALQDDDLRESILAASRRNLILELLDKKGGNDNDNVEQEADRIAKDFLRNAGFKLEGE